ncbi:MAG: response regulator [Bacteroidales bacterium]|nr:response regulator [Bacteroidales bacterium]
MSKAKILIVEDDSMLCTVFEMFLEELGYSHSGTFASGEAALAHMENDQPDLILMDIHLEGEIDGVDTAKIIFEKYNIPIIYISGVSDVSTVKRAVLNNTYGFMTKPVYRNSLELNIEFAIAKHQLLNI